MIVSPLGSWRIVGEERAFGMENSETSREEAVDAVIDVWVLSIASSVLNLGLV